MSNRRRGQSFSFLLAVTLCLVTALGACKSGPGTDPILRLSAQEALDRGKALMGDEKYFRARELLTHAYEVEPNSLAGREALLLTADSFYLDGGNADYIQAEARYRDFLNRFPTSDKAAYAQFQIANSLAQRMRRPDRDLTATEDALSAYQDLIRLYPTSEYAAQARDKTRLVKENLADHELLIGEFYLRYRLFGAAAKRFEYLLDHYPAYSEKDKALLKLGVAYVRAKQPDKAQETYERLAREYPDSPYLEDFPEIPEPKPAEASADEGAKTAADGGQPAAEPADAVAPASAGDGGGG